jgi:hypothetical protein
MADPSLYHTDFHTWLSHQHHALTHRDSTALDWDNLAAEINDMGVSERNELKNRLLVLLLHLLKWQYQSPRRSISWFTTIANQRDDLLDLLAASPSLSQYTPELLGKAYRNARRAAAAETGLSLNTFPPSCPYPLDQLLDPEFICNTTADFETALAST